MKNLIICVFVALTGICCLGTVCAISGRNAREMELKANLGTAVETTVEREMKKAESGTEEETDETALDCQNQCCCKNEWSFIQQVYVWS